MSVEGRRLEKKIEEERFKFGENWSKYLRHINSERVHEAEKSLLRMFELQDFSKQSFLDAGCGSGLFSLAARNLGAKVFSFDSDRVSVRCAEELKNRFYENDEKWQVELGSVLDYKYLEKLEQYDLVYCWGVLHHTGAMVKGLQHIVLTVKPRGKIFISIYNNQGFFTKYWRLVKRTYVRYPVSRPFFILLHTLYPLIPSLVFKKLRKEKIPRGMSAWYDLLDWLGGYPFETSTVSDIFEFFKTNGFQLKKIKTVGGKMGCNEFVFQKR